MSAARVKSIADKPHLETIPVGLDDGWQPMAGLAGIECKPLVDNLDEGKQTGMRTRLVRFAPGAFTPGQFSHTDWEEFFLLSGDFKDLARNQHHWAHVHSCRPPDTPHGPFRSEGGCVIFEVQHCPAPGLFTPAEDSRDSPNSREQGAIRSHSGCCGEDLQRRWRPFGEITLRARPAQALR